MQQGKASVTALSAAYLRVYHYASESQHIFADPFAQHLMSDEEKAELGPLQVEAFAHLFPDLLEQCATLEERLRATVPRLGIASEVLARAVFAEQSLANAVAGDVRQYVLLGAGFDTFALRNPGLANQMTIFEVDHPATQAEKRARLKAAALELPGNHHFVPVDFEHDDLGSALDAAGYNREAPAMFSWLGVIPYLTQEAVSATLSNLRQVAAPGSEIVFDYTVLKEDASLASRAIVEALEQAVAALGESFMSSYTDQSMAAIAREAGWQVAEDLGPEEIGERFIPAELGHYVDPDFVRYMRLGRP